MLIGRGLGTKAEMSQFPTNDNFEPIHSYLYNFNRVKTGSCTKGLLNNLFSKDKFYIDWFHDVILAKFVSWTQRLSHFLKMNLTSIDLYDLSAKCIGKA